jgi:hypothetical protein
LSRQALRWPKPSSDASHSRSSPAPALDAVAATNATAAGAPDRTPPAAANLLDRISKGALRLHR